jgi:hypothetical protein
VFQRQVSLMISRLSPNFKLLPKPILIWTLDLHGDESLHFFDGSQVRQHDILLNEYDVLPRLYDIELGTIYAVGERRVVVRALCPTTLARGLVIISHCGGIDKG